MLRPRPNRPAGERGEAGCRQQHRAERPEAREPRLRQRRALAHRRDRRHARRADRRAQAREQRDEDADEQRDDRPSASRTTRPLFGSVKPTASNSLKSPFASAKPSEEPDHRRERCRRRAPRSTIEVSTCRRDAPSVRSVANSRVRCAIVIESEFAITKRRRRARCRRTRAGSSARNEMKLVVSDASSVACASPVRTCVSGGRICADLGRSCRVRRPTSPATRDLVQLARACRTGAARSAGRSRRASRRRSSRRSPNLTMPGDPQLLHRPVRPATPTVWPTSKCSFSAVDLSITTSFWPRPRARRRASAG